MSSGLTLAVGAELCIPQAAQIQADWLQALSTLESGQAGQVTLPLGGVEAIDSAGLQLLLALKARLEQHGGQLRLAEPSKVVQEALRTFGLDAGLQPMPGGAG